MIDRKRSRRLMKSKWQIVVQLLSFQLTLFWDTNPFLEFFSGIDFFVKHFLALSKMYLSIPCFLHFDVNKTIHVCCLQFRRFQPQFFQIKFLQFLYKKRRSPFNPKKESLDFSQFFLLFLYNYKKITKSKIFSSKI